MKTKACTTERCSSAPPFPPPHPRPQTMSGRAKGAVPGMIRSALSLHAARPRITTKTASFGSFPFSNEVVAAANTSRLGGGTRGGAMWAGALQSCTGVLGAGAGSSQTSLFGSSSKSSAPLGYALAHAARAMCSSSSDEVVAGEAGLPRVPKGMVWALRRSKPALRDFTRCRPHKVSTFPRLLSHPDITGT